MAECGVSCPRDCVSHSKCESWGEELGVLLSGWKVSGRALPYHAFHSPVASSAKRCHHPLKDLKPRKYGWQMFPWVILSWVSAGVARVRAVPNCMCALLSLQRCSSSHLESSPFLRAPWCLVGEPCGSGVLGQQDDWNPGPHGQSQWVPKCTGAGLSQAPGELECQ